ncbi:MAG: hypothetical protein V3W41_06370 [Planctomycetota bacterium]
MDFRHALPIVILVPLGLVGLWIFYHLLRLLQRRLNLFTKGTLTFMAASLLAFALFDLFLLGHELRNEDFELRRDSQERLVVRVVRALSDESAQGDIVEINSSRWRKEFSKTRDDLLSDLHNIDPELSEFKDFTLISLNVEEPDMFSVQRVRHPWGRSWRITGIFVRDCEVRVLEGNVSTRRDDDGRVRIDSIFLEILDGKDAKSSTLRRQYRRQSDFRVEGYRYDKTDKCFRKRGV